MKSSEIETESGGANVPHYDAGKWLVGASVLTGTFLSVMDVTVVNVAMPHMMTAFHQSLLSITWVSTAYSIAEIIMITMTAFWSTLLGRKRLFLMSMTIFIVGSALAGTSQTFGQMLFYRVLQGFGGGALIPASQAITREKFPPAEQGMAMALFSMGVMLAPTLGPVLGGWLIDHWGWRWIFYINVPIAIAGVAMVTAFVHDPPYLKRGFERIDWIGIALLTVGLTSLQLVLERGQSFGWFASNWIIAGAIVATLTVVGLIIWELISAEPIINFRLFRNFRLSIGSGLGAVIGFALFGSTFLLPQMTQEVLGYPAFRAGLVLFPRAASMLLIMPIVGRLYNVVSPRILVSFGVLVLAVSFWQLSNLTTAAQFSDFVGPLIETGIGIGCSMVLLSTISLSSLRRADMTAAAGIYTLVRRVSGNVSYAVLATLVERWTTFYRTPVPAVGGHDPALPVPLLNEQARLLAYTDCYKFLAFMFVVALPLTLLLPKKGVPAEAVEKIDE
ncbi:MAG TPA: DHA2 family efflux MFS transporter permease subunit [Candidatus Binataceae bacterium]|nr:DHA2 family efflux MFS transporter permease subunit [Candidatus Binataceae bacterium]